MGKRNSLTDFEVSIIKNLLASPTKFQNQEIAGMINRYRGDASKDINSGRISNIKNGEIKKYLNIEPASNEDAQIFLKSYNEKTTVIHNTGSPVSKKRLNELLPLKKGSKTYLNIIETDLIECKKSINLPMKTVAAFANNNGGYIVAGVMDKTWQIVGVDEGKLAKFDFNTINQNIRSQLGIEIEIKREILEFGKKKVAVFHVSEAHTKPVIFCKAGDGVGEGHIYYRYVGEDRLISAADLQKIIEERIRKMSELVLNKHLSRILQVGIDNAAVMDLSTGEVEGKAGSFYIDEKLLPNLEFIKEGEFVEKAGAPTLKLVGEVEISAKVAGYVRENIFKLYPLTWKELMSEVKKGYPDIKQQELNRIIRDHKIKESKEYSGFLFTNKNAAENYANSGKLPENLPMSRYNQKAVEFIASKYQEG